MLAYPDPPMDLSGTWRAALADDDLRRGALGLDFDDDGWEAVPVPGHWRSVPAFSSSDGPLLYRTRFELDAGPAGARHWVVLDGVFYQADVFLDGAYLGDPEGYFFPHSYEITDLARLGAEHVLAVEVACSPPPDRRAKRNLTGIFQHWDCMDPTWNPGGLWRGVRIERTGPVRINRLRVLCRDAEPARANVMVRAELDSDDARTVRVRTTLDGDVERELEHPLAKGTNSVEWTFGVDNPQLWWPRALGDQPLGQLEVTVSVDHEPSHARWPSAPGCGRWPCTTGCSRVNGERLFLKGANAGPDPHGAGRGHTGRSPPRRRARRRRRPRPAARPRSHHAARAVRGRRRARHADLAGPPAAVGLRPLGRQAGGPPGRRGGRPARPPPVGRHLVRSQRAGGARRAARRADHAPRLAMAFVAGQELPSWNRSILDARIKRTLERADGTRPVIAHSGVAPHLPQLDGTDSHLYFGWYHGRGARPARLRRRRGPAWSAS